MLDTHLLRFDERVAPNFTERVFRVMTPAP